ncbi:2-hydroxyacylsphingosine 1-beta-galactosyltransferase-like [Tubulanus polymorphus]|uniref:2-hydroxyacylsphingosine 1-beta-galactosyltransferase-like n=1 Tax=Tubulanus polymorphus TaxID=672921 RepID=UPI003DA1F9F6
MKAVVAVVMAMTLGGIHSAKVALIAPPATSHMQQLIVIGDELVKRYGHDVSFIAPTTVRDSPILAGTSVDVIWYEAPDDMYLYETDGQKQRDFLTLSLEATNPLSEIRFAVDVFRPVCETLLGDRVLFETLLSRRFDFGLADGIFFMQCSYILFDKLKIPYGTVTTLVMPDQIVPTLAVPSIKIHADVEALDFRGRVINTLFATLGYGLVSWVTDPSSRYEKYCRQTPCPSYQRLQGDSKLWLIDVDELLDVPVPSMPHVFHVGGLSVRPTQPLTGEFKTIADSANQSLVLVSFGGTVSFLAEEYVNKVVEAMRALPRYTFVFKFKQKMKNVPKNVHIVNWLPQRDILAHRNTRLFITHCGNAGLHETLYGGVPVLGIPFYGDQPANAQKIERRGYGLGVKITSVTTEELIAAIEEVITNPTYRKNIHKSSLIYRSKEFASVRAGKILDGVLKHGFKHIQPPSKDLYLFQLLLIDVILLFALITIVSIILLYVCLRSVYRKCCSPPRNKEKTA